jgi:hypothetical protein
MILKSTTDQQINNHFKNFPSWGGVFSNDAFARTVKPDTNKFYILNLENEQQGGSHWTLLDCRKRKILYVDSFGLLPTSEIHNWITATSRKASYLSTNLQGFHNASCGYFATYFAEQLSNRTLKNILTGDFTNNSDYNERVLERYFTSH